MKSIAILFALLTLAILPRCAHSPAAADELLQAVEKQDLEATKRAVEKISHLDPSPQIQEAANAAVGTEGSRGVHCNAGILTEIFKLPFAVTLTDFELAQSADCEGFVLSVFDRKDPKERDAYAQRVHAVALQKFESQKTLANQIVKSKDIFYTASSLGTLDGNTGKLWRLVIALGEMKQWLKKNCPGECRYPKTYDQFMADKTREGKAAIAKTPKPEQKATAERMALESLYTPFLGNPRRK